MLSLRVALRRLKGYLISGVDYAGENPEAPFVLAFMILLLGAAVELGFGSESRAERLAEYAYYSLVLAVLISLARIILSNDEEEGGENRED